VLPVGDRHVDQLDGVDRVGALDVVGLHREHEPVRLVDAERFEADEGRDSRQGRAVAVPGELALGLAGVADAVSVTVELVGVGELRAVVDRVPVLVGLADPVAVCVRDAAAVDLELLHGAGVLVDRLGRGLGRRWGRLLEILLGRGGAQFGLVVADLAAGQDCEGDGGGHQDLAHGNTPPVGALIKKRVFLPAVVATILYTLEVYKRATTTFIYFERTLVIRRKMLLSLAKRE